MPKDIIIALIISAAPVLAVALSWWDRRQAEKRRALAVDAQLYGIHDLVNSRLSAALKRIEAQTAEIQRLNEHLSKGTK